jgi:hypothetical protein
MSSAEKSFYFLFAKRIDRLLEQKIYFNASLLSLIKSKKLQKKSKEACQ